MTFVKFVASKILFLEKIRFRVSSSKTGASSGLRLNDGTLALDWSICIRSLVRTRRTEVESRPALYSYWYQ